MAMCDKFKGTSMTITRWCDTVHVVIAKDNSVTKWPPTKREWNRKEVYSIFMELRKKHQDFEAPKLRLWVRMIANGIHYNMVLCIPPKQTKCA